MLMKQVSPGDVRENGKHLRFESVISAVEDCYGKKHSFPRADQAFVTIEI